MNDATTNEIAAVREEARIRIQRGAYVYLIMIVTVICACAATLLTMRYLSDRAIRESESKLCAIVILSDDTYRQNPPTTELGRKQAQNFSDLRKSLGCKPYREA